MILFNCTKLPFMHVLETSIYSKKYCYVLKFIVKTSTSSCYFFVNLIFLIFFYFFLIFLININSNKENY